MIRLLLPLILFLLIHKVTLGNVEHMKDSSGKTLQEVRDKYFSKCLKHHGNTAKFTTIGHKNQAKAYFQLNKPYYQTTRNLFLSEADKLNGISLKTTSFVRSSSYRQQWANTNKWTEWRTGTPAFANWLTVYINIKHGKFEVIPVTSSKYIRKSATTSNGKAPRTLRELASPL